MQSTPNMQRTKPLHPFQRIAIRRDIRRTAHLQANGEQMEAAEWNDPPFFGSLPFFTPSFLFSLQQLDQRFAGHLWPPVNPL